MSNKIRQFQKRKNKEMMNNYFVNFIRDLVRFKNFTDDFISPMQCAKDSTCQELKDLSAKIDKDYDLSQYEVKDAKQ